MQLYRNIILESIKLAWRNKYLWFFGLFASFLASGGGYEIAVRTLNAQGGISILDLQGFIDTRVFSFKGLENLILLAQDDFFSFLMIIIIFLVIVSLFIYLVWMAIVCQAAIIDQAGEILKNKARRLIASRKQTIREGISLGRKSFWPVLGFNALLKFIFVAIFTILSAFLFLAAGQEISLTVNLTFILFFFIFVVLVLSLSFITKYAIAFTVLEGETFLKSIRLGGSLFIKNIILSLELAFILFIINFLVGFALMLLILIVETPFILLAIIAYKTASFIFLWIILIIALIAGLAVLAIVKAILTTFQIAAWTNLFQKLRSDKARSKIMRILDIKPAKTKRRKIIKSKKK